MKHFVIVGLAASLILSGCSRNEVSVTEVRKHFAVTGSHADVMRFAKLQSSRQPTLSVSAIKDLGSDKAQAEVMLPADFDSQDLVHITREALAADLNYTFEERHSVKPAQT